MPSPQDIGEDKPDDDFKIRFTRLLMETGTKVDAISELTGKKVSAVLAWKRGRQVPGGNAIIKMAKLFDCTTDYLLGASMVRGPSPKNEELILNA